MSIFSRQMEVFSFISPSITFSMSGGKFLLTAYRLLRGMFTVGFLWYNVMSYEFANWIASLEAHDWILSNWCVFGHAIR